MARPESVAVQALTWDDIEPAACERRGVLDLAGVDQPPPLAGAGEGLDDPGSTGGGRVARNRRGWHAVRVTRGSTSSNEAGLSCRSDGRCLGRHVIERSVVTGLGQLFT